MSTRAGKIILCGYEMVCLLLYNSAFTFSAFCYIPQLPELEALIKKESQKILTPLVSLDTPGKATVEVVILADPVSGLDHQYETLIITLLLDENANRMILISGWS